MTETWQFERQARRMVLAGYDPHCMVTEEPRYGWHLVLDLHGCSRDLENGAILREWVTNLVQHIGMKAYGPPVVDHFGHGDPVTSGYTVVQLIETSSITAHLSPHLGTAHIDVFSCRWFDPVAAIEFCESRLGGGPGRASFLPRG